jgi:hypothetical protein
MNDFTPNISYDIPFPNLWYQLQRRIMSHSRRQQPVAGSFFQVSGHEIRLYIGYNWKVQTKYGHEFHTPKQKKISGTICVRKHLIFELQPKECCTCMMVLRHVVALLCEVPYHDQGIGRGGPTAWPPPSPDFNLVNFCLWGHLNS